ncbi:MAG: hypothetical protein LBC87_12090 [Fibromonadaceae bacterium]|jgi:predicted GIY-YIG superfamily endonuclease|nr:hypothetical protein [Fibromonadaceae bacterium]
MSENARIPVLVFKKPQPITAYVEEFVSHALEHTGDKPLDRWYAGITSNINERIKSHESKKHITCKYIKCMRCPSENFTRKVEKALEEEGFSIYTEDEKTAMKATMEGKSFSTQPPKDKVYIYYGVPKK